MYLHTHLYTHTHSQLALAWMDLFVSQMEWGVKQGEWRCVWEENGGPSVTDTSTMLMPTLCAGLYSIQQLVRFETV